MNTIYDHPEYRALLAAVLETPDDDLPRLVLADWLEEHGDTDRAVYIRCEVALPVSKPRVCNKTNTVLVSRGVVGPLFVSRCRCRTCATVRRSYMSSRRHIHVEWERDLRAVGLQRWVMEWNPATDDYRATIPGASFFWNRGFVEEVRCDLRGLIAHARSVLENCPVRTIHLTDINEQWEIDPPGEEYGWQGYYYLVGAGTDYYTMDGWETREEMVEAIVRHATEGMPA